MSGHRLVILVGALFILSALSVSAQERLPQFLEHTVKTGETLNSITSRYSVNAKDFLMLNDFPETIKLKPGQKVLIRELKEGERPEKEMMAESKPMISEKPSTAAKQKMQEQPIERSAPMSSGRSVEGPGGVMYKISDTGYHTVERGQTFYRISLVYGISTDELKQLNNLPNTTVSVGQKLRVSK